MSGRRWRLAGWAAAGIATGLGLVVVELLAPDRRLAARVYLLAVATVAVLWLLGWARPETRWPRRSALDHAWARPLPQPPRPADLRRLEQTLYFASASATDLHHRLRPLLREIAALRLAERHGVALDAEPERARAVLGPDLWEVVRPDRAEPVGPARGLDPATLRSLVDTLAAI